MSARSSRSPGPCRSAATSKSPETSCRNGPRSLSRDCMLGLDSPSRENLAAPPPRTASACLTRCQRSLGWHGTGPIGRPQIPLTWRRRAEEAVHQGDTKLELVAAPRPVCSSMENENHLRDFGLWLSHDQSISELNLCSTRLVDRDLSYFANALRESRTLLRLDLSMNKIGRFGVKQLANVLQKNDSLQDLRLGCNHFGDEGLKHLATMLSVNKCVKLVDLSDTGISALGGRSLAKMLRNNDVLKDVLLGCNQLADTGVCDIAASLNRNNTLQKLLLNSNRVGDAGAVALSEAVSGNTTLQVLDLRSNMIGDRGVQNLTFALRKSYALRQLEVTLDGISESVAAAFLNSSISSMRTALKDWMEVSTPNSPEVCSSSPSSTCARQKDDSLVSNVSNCLFSPTSLFSAVTPKKRHRDAKSTVSSPCSLSSTRASPGTSTQVPPCGSPRDYLRCRDVYEDAIDISTPECTPEDGYSLCSTFASIDASNTRSDRSEITTIFLRSAIENSTSEPLLPSCYASPEFLESCHDGHKNVTSSRTPSVASKSPRWGMTGLFNASQPPPFTPSAKLRENSPNCSSSCVSRSSSRARSAVPKISGMPLGSLEVSSVSSNCGSLESLEVASSKIVDRPRNDPRPLVVCRV